MDEEKRTQSPRRKPSMRHITAVIRDVNLKGHKKACPESGLSVTSPRDRDNEMSPPRAHSVVTLSPPDAQRAEEQTYNSFVDQSRLDYKLLAALIREPWTNRQFLPRGDLDKLVTRGSMERELSRRESLPTKIFRHTRRSSVKFQIQMPPEDEAASRGQTGQDYGDATTKPDGTYYKQVFAILLLIDQPESIWSFVKEKVCDADLPLEGNMLELRRRGNVTTALKCLRRSFDIHRFLEYQWCVLAPIFRKPNRGTDSHIKACKYHILPFTAWKDVGRQGGFAQVYKAEVHHEHHEFGANEVPKNVVAVKRVRLTNRADFSRESNVLQNLGKELHAHDHLVTLLASYEQHDYLCLILPWAEADLHQYWRKDPRSLGSDAKVSTWLRQQCCGLAEAVSQIHRYQTLSDTLMHYHKTSVASQSEYQPSLRQSTQSSRKRNPKSLFGRHGDIKPKNILWYPPVPSARATDNEFGTLKLSDFGTTRFSDNEHISVQDKKTVPYSRAYQSPECQLEGGELSSQCDVWALGCVFLEFLCWYFGGYQRLRDFETERNRIHQNTSFFFIDWQKQQSRFAELKPPVIEMIEKLREESTSKDELLRVLNAVDKDMLLILDDGAYAGPSTDGADVSTSSDFLAVTRQTRHGRRKSVANIARSLGSLLPTLRE